MHIESLHDAPLIETVLAMQREMSRADTEADLVYSFAKRFHEISGVTEVLDLDVRNLGAGSFRVMDRLRIPELTRANVRDNARWDVPLESLPVCSGGVIGELVRGEAPKICRDLTPGSDPVLDGWLGGPRDVLAVPVYHKGDIDEWLVVFRSPGEPLDPMQLRVGISSLNMISRGAYQFKLMQQVRELHGALEAKLEEVARVQRSILPQSHPEHPALDFAAAYRASDFASGDYYDFRRFEDGSIGFMIADVAGHGPAAAVVMAMLRTAASIYRHLNMSSDNVVHDLNRFLWDGLSDGVFVTAFFAKLHPGTGQLDYTRAGHCPARVRRADGTVIRLDTGGGPPLGVLPEMETTGGDIVLAPGDAAVLFTDGVTEAFNTRGEMFGDARLDEAIRTCSADTAESVVAGVIEAVDAHAAGRARADDHRPAQAGRALRPAAGHSARPTRTRFSSPFSLISPIPRA